LPKRGEARPQSDSSWDGVRHPSLVAELRGKSSLPDGAEPSSPSVCVSIHTIGGFCAVSSELPLRSDLDVGQLQTEHHTTSVQSNGLNPHFGGQAIHCVAAEPQQTFVRVSIIDNAGGSAKEVAYETAVLGRLRRGYRVFRLRSALGSRIELCCLLVKISFGTEACEWTRPSEQRIRSKRQHDALTSLKASLLQEQEGKLDALAREHQREVALLKAQLPHVGDLPTIVSQKEVSVFSSNNSSRCDADSLAGL